MTPSPDQFLQHGALGVLALFILLVSGIVTYLTRELIRLGERGVAALEKIPQDLHTVSDKITVTSETHTNMLIQLITGQKATHERVEFIATRGCPIWANVVIPPSCGGTGTCGQ
jgi:hypothetical protein